MSNNAYSIKIVSKFMFAEGHQYLTVDIIILSTEQELKQLFGIDADITIKQLEKKDETIAEASSLQTEQIKVFQFRPIIQTMKLSKKQAKSFLNSFDMVYEVLKRGIPNYTSKLQDRSNKRFVKNELGRWFTRYERFL